MKCPHQRVTHKLGKAKWYWRRSAQNCALYTTALVALVLAIKRPLASLVEHDIIEYKPLYRV